MLTFESRAHRPKQPFFAQYSPLAALGSLIAAFSVSAAYSLLSTHCLTLAAACFLFLAFFFLLFTLPVLFGPGLLETAGDGKHG